MTIWICCACGIENADTTAPPESCEICQDDRQYVPATGQEWTTHSELAAKFSGSVQELEPELYAVTVRPRFAIGHRGLLLRTDRGNVLFEPPGVFSEDLIAQVRELGGVLAVAASHPHLVGAAVSWAREFSAPFFFGAADQGWVRRPDELIAFWSNSREIMPGVTLIQCGGHFPGSCVLHWAAGAEGRGVLLVGDTMMVGADLATVSFMRSYPNLIPLPERLVRGVTAALEPYAFDRLYGGFGGSMIARGAKDAVAFSQKRYLGWLNDEIRDADEVG